MKNRTLRGLVILAAIIIVLALLASCAQPMETFTGQCAVQPIASQERIVFVNVHCETAE